MRAAPENLDNEALRKTCVSPVIVRCGGLCNNSIEVGVKGEKGGEESSRNCLERLSRVGETLLVWIGGKQLCGVSALELVAFDELAQSDEGGVDAGGVAAGKEVADFVEQTRPLGGKVHENEPSGGLREDALDICCADNCEGFENVVAETLASEFR